MDHGHTIVLGQRLLDRLLIVNVTFNGDHRLSTDLLDPLQRFTVAVRKIIKNNDLFAAFKKFDTCVRTDISGAARYKNHLVPILVRIAIGLCRVRQSNGLC